MTVVTRFLWAVWILGCVAFLGFTLQTHRVVPFPPGVVHHLLFAVAALWFIEVFVLGIVVGRKNPVHLGIQRYVEPQYRMAVADIVALVGFGCFPMLGAIATLSSRNAFYYIADCAVGLFFLAIYACRRNTICVALRQ